MQSACPRGAVVASAAWQVPQAGRGAAGVCAAVAWQLAHGAWPVDVTIAGVPPSGRA
ncbi:MAG: hypothetical protein NT062_25810 [Proteobacteria bacterium]|nr:hypothetical protein [Pseudomonadota bacterium]